MLRTFLVTFPCGQQKEYEALSAQQLRNHLNKFYKSFVLELV
jgi:hypothetical protein